MSPQEALAILEKQENITFSYNPQNFNFPTEIYICKRNASLQEVVEIITETKVELIIENRHVIIKPARTSNSSKKQKFYKITGTVENSVNGMPVDSVLIQVAGQFYYTNPSGYFNFFIKPGSDSVSVYFEKTDYTSYVTDINAGQDNSLRIMLEPLTDIDFTYLSSTVKDKNSTIENFWLTNIVVSDDQTSLSKNRRALIDRDMQFSIIPGLGTFNQESGLYRYKRSFNVLAGYVGEIYGYELGLGLNVVRYDLTGFEFAGIANIVGGEVSGIQTAFGANISVGNCKGVQSALICNTTWGNFNGFQASTGINVVRTKHRGLQLAPVNLVVDTLLGWQIGVVNFSFNASEGVQISALANYTPTNDKLQYSTFLNSTTFNNAPQLGIINTATIQNNLQLGIFNFADTVPGTTIGFLSFVKNGFTHLDYSLNGDLFSSLKFKTGTQKFYNIISASFRPDKEPDFAVGYGFGSHFRLWKMFGINYDLVASQIFENNTLNQNLNLLGQFNLNLNFSIAKHFTIYAGAQFNSMLSTNLAYDAINFESSIPPPNAFYNKQYDFGRLYLWPGFLIGVRI